MLRVILVDDEPLARQGLREMLAEQAEVRVAGEAESASAAVALIQQQRPDALFLDINMPGATGFDLLAGLEVTPKIVIVTGYMEYAVRAFEVDAVDFLLKPVRPDRLAQAVRRLMNACVPDEPETGAQRFRPEDRICLRVPNRTVIAKLDDVSGLRADGDFTRVFVANETPLMICQSLGKYETTLPNPPFVRLDRSLMINVDSVERVKKISRDEEHLWLRGVAEPFILGRKASGELAHSLAKK